MNLTLGKLQYVHERMGEIATYDNGMNVNGTKEYILPCFFNVKGMPGVDTLG